MMIKADFLTGRETWALKGISGTSTFFPGLNGMLMFTPLLKDAEILVCKLFIVYSNNMRQTRNQTKRGHILSDRKAWTQAANSGSCP
jgi:hypothetical protein